VILTQQKFSVHDEKLPSFTGIKQVLTSAAAKLSAHRAIELRKDLRNIFRFLLLPETNPNMPGFWCVCPAVQTRKERDTVRAVK
jgi:hypothetical protein